MLGYVFNFSVLFSNYALEAIYTIVVFNKRIDAIILKAQQFEKENEREADINTSFEKPEVTIDANADLGLKLCDVTAFWSPSDVEPPVKQVSFDIKGPLNVALIGRCGSGKTTLLHTILKETYLREG